MLVDLADRKGPGDIHVRSMTENSLACAEILCYFSWKGHQSKEMNLCDHVFTVCAVHIRFILNVSDGSYCVMFLTEVEASSCT